MTWRWPKWSLARIADALERLVFIQAAFYSDQKTAIEADKKMAAELLKSAGGMAQALKMHVDECLAWQSHVERSMRAQFEVPNDEEKVH